ncbi:MAG: hypothetical protein LBO72_01640 [Helicobacteraceae bacterium]|jgi:hypothetical protein|nr:hypothetical protein [Helicobacteraceae bacterium]
MKETKAPKEQIMTKSANEPKATATGNEQDNDPKFLNRRHIAVDADFFFKPIADPKDYVIATAGAGVAVCFGDRQTQTGKTQKQAKND